MPNQTNITANLAKGAGEPLVGFIRVSPDYRVIDGDTGQVTLPVYSDIPLVNGQAVFSLEPSELARVTYLFQIWQTGVPAGTPNVLISEFRALVPISSTAIALADLMGETGLYRDVLATGIQAISQRLVTDSNFWSALQAQLFSPKGEYTSTAWYTLGSVVTLGGSSYIYRGLNPTRGQSPRLVNGSTNTEYWQLLASKGDTGSGTSGDPTAYGPAWAGQGNAPSRGALFNLIESLATRLNLEQYINSTGSVLTNCSVSNNYPLTEDSSRIPPISWVRSWVQSTLRTNTPIGTVAWFAGSSAPTLWLPCDGRLVSRASYSELFAILGTSFNTGAPTENSNNFRLPDLRGRSARGLDSSPSTGVAGVAPGLTLGNRQGQASTTLGVSQLPIGTWTFQPGLGNFNIAGNAGSDHRVLTASPSSIPTLGPSLGLLPIIYTGI